MTSSDAWGRSSSEQSDSSEADVWHRASPSFRRDERLTAVSRDRWVMWSVARGVLFSVGGLLALPLALQAGYGGINLSVVVLLAGLAPAAVVCWVKAAGERGSDRWTAGYVAAYAFCLLVLVPVGAALRRIG